MSSTTTGVSAPSVFNFQSHEVRTVTRGGDVWFVASDVCKALGYANPSKAVADHLDDDERSNEQLDRSRMGSKAVIISESGLYALVLRSRKPEARKFAKWVTAEVLPSIRKTGSYADVSAKAGTYPPLNPDGSVDNVAALRMIGAYVKHGRFMLTFGDDGRMNLREISGDAFVVAEAQIESVLNEPGVVSLNLLPGIIGACVRRLGEVAISHVQYGNAQRAA